MYNAVITTVCLLIISCMSCMGQLCLIDFLLIMGISIFFIFMVVFDYTINIMNSLLLGARYVYISINII